MIHLIPTCQDLEGAVEDVLRPLRTIAGVFWLLHSKPKNEEEQIIIDLCVMVEEAANQITYLIEHASIGGKSVAFASLDHSSPKEASHKAV